MLILILPYLTLPCLALPYLTLPYLALPLRCTPLLLWRVREIRNRIRSRKNIYCNEFKFSKNVVFLNCSLNLPKFV